MISSSRGCQAARKIFKFRPPDGAHQQSPAKTHGASSNSLPHPITERPRFLLPVSSTTVTFETPVARQLTYSVECIGLQNLAVSPGYQNHNIDVSDGDFIKDIKVNDLRNRYHSPGRPEHRREGMIVCPRAQLDGIKVSGKNVPSQSGGGPNTALLAPSWRPLRSLVSRTGLPGRGLIGGPWEGRKLIHWRLLATIHDGGVQVTRTGLPREALCQPPASSLMVPPGAALDSEGQVIKAEPGAGEEEEQVSYS
ncbi:hypothetical protein V8F20_011253 [Naviculisporaceae sp. PSN 640]